MVSRCDEASRVSVSIKERLAVTVTSSSLWGLVEVLYRTIAQVFVYLLAECVEKIGAQVTVRHHLAIP